MTKYIIFILLLSISCSDKGVEPIITGCMDDGNCTEDTCGYDSENPGISACNYDPDATEDDVSCLPPIGDTCISFEVGIQPILTSNCTECHGDTPVALAPVRPNQMLLERQLDFLRVSDPGASGFSSAPPLSGGVFLRGWKGQTVANLYQFARSEMPQGSPGSLTDQQYADIIAYMFNLSRLPAGENELPPDAQQLNMIIIEPVASKSAL